MNFHGTNILEFLVVNRTPSVNPKVMADIFERLMWVIEHEEMQVSRTFESWLRSSDDRYKVEVALNAEEIMPFENNTDMRNVLSEVVKKWPDLKELCEKYKRGFEF